ncbi:deaminase, partial [Staphylococcus capitis]|uniref:deaminase n=1 Tax=Staphylococcus capitis TaxID=29388 RepID=UPI00370998FE
MKEGEKGEGVGEVAIGGVIVKNDEVIGDGDNLRECLQERSGQGEEIGIEGGCKVVGSWGLEECSVYVRV